MALPVISAFFRTAPIDRLRLGTIESITTHAALATLAGNTCIKRR